MLAPSDRHPRQIRELLGVHVDELNQDGRSDHTAAVVDLVYEMGRCPTAGSREHAHQLLSGLIADWSIILEVGLREPLRAFLLDADAGAVLIKEHPTAIMKLERLSRSNQSLVMSGKLIRGDGELRMAFTSGSNKSIVN